MGRGHERYPEVSDEDYSRKTSHFIHLYHYHVTRVV